MKLEDLTDLVRRCEDMEERGIFEKGRAKKEKRKFWSLMNKEEEETPSPAYLIVASMPGPKYEFYTECGEHYFKNRKDFIAFMAKMGHEPTGTITENGFDGDPDYQNMMATISEDGTRTYMSPGMTHHIFGHDNE